MGRRGVQRLALYGLVVFCLFGIILAINATSPYGGPGEGSAAGGLFVAAGLCIVALARVAEDRPKDS